MERLLRVRWDLSAYFVDHVRDQNIPCYVRVDAGLTWRWPEPCSISVVEQNLVRDHYEDFVDPIASADTGPMKPGAYVNATSRF